MPKSANIEIFLDDVQCSYPGVFHAESYKGQKDSKPRYTCGFILDKKKHKKKINEVLDAIDDAIYSVWKDKPPKFKEDKMCFIDGDDTDKEELQGKWLLRTARAEKLGPPQVLGANARPIDEKSGKPYGGCMVDAIVTIFAMEEYVSVNSGLEAVQYRSKGEPFGRGPVDTSKFKVHEDDDPSDYKSMRRGKRDDDDDEDEKPARRRASRDDDEDEKPARRRASRDDDEGETRSSRTSRRSTRDDDEDAPRSRRSRAAEPDDEDDPPARRRGRGRDEDDEDEKPAGRSSRSRSSRDDDDEPRARRRSRDDD